MNADISIMNHYLKPLTSVCTKNFPMMIPFTEITSKKVLLKVNFIKIGTLEENGEKHIHFATFFPDTACVEWKLEAVDGWCHLCKSWYLEVLEGKERQ